MRQYGRLLEDFQNNTPFLNDCIFTVIPFSLIAYLRLSHQTHILGDAPHCWGPELAPEPLLAIHPQVLLQDLGTGDNSTKENLERKPTFEFEQGLQICEDWVDLIEFIIQKFIQTMGSSPHTCAANMVRARKQRRKH